MGFLKEFLNILKLAWEIPQLKKEMKRVERMSKNKVRSKIPNTGDKEIKRLGDEEICRFSDEGFEGVKR